MRSRGSLVVLLLGALPILVGCSDMVSSYEVLAHGVPTVPYDEAPHTEHRWFRVENATVRTDILGHYTYQHGRHADEQRFVAPLVSSENPDAYGALWVGCQSSGADLAEQRARCLERMSVESPVVAFENLGLFRQALDDATGKHGLDPNNPRILRIPRSVENEAWENFIAPALLIVVAALVAVGAYSKRRRRA